MYGFLQISFLVSALLIIYPYTIYVLILKIFVLLKEKSIQREEIYPLVTVLIPAFNEANWISETIQNKLDQYYPEESLEVIVISDESTDGTDEIVQSFMEKSSRVKLIRQEPRQGKASGLNLAIKEATGEIIVFSDANSIFDQNAIKHIVENYHDKTVGYTTGMLIYVAKGDTLSEQGSSAYIKFENIIRELETKFDSIIGANGGVDSIRKDLYRDIPQDQITDFILPLHVMGAKKRVIYDSRVQCFEEANTTVNSEFKMRVRVALRGIRGLIYMRHLFNPFKFGRSSFCLISHKFIRYLGPIFIISLFISNLFLFEYHAYYRYLLFIQLLIYAIAILNINGIQMKFASKLTNISTYFLVSNAAFLVAIFKLINGETMSMWKPRES